jgi:hypothetical protein
MDNVVPPTTEPVPDERVTVVVEGAHGTPEVETMVPSVIPTVIVVRGKMRVGAKFVPLSRC